MLIILIIRDHQYVVYSTLLFAGHETSSTVMSFISLELARNPKVQSVLRDEIRKMEASVHARGDPRLTAADLEAMPYLNAVIKVIGVSLACTISIRSIGRFTAPPVGSPHLANGVSRFHPSPFQANSHTIRRYDQRSTCSQRHRNCNIYCRVQSVGSTVT